MNDRLGYVQRPCVIFLFRGNFKKNSGMSASVFFFTLLRE
jgi:hypothetical protein